MGALTLDDQRCVSTTVTIPMFGPWTADVMLATGDGPEDGANVLLRIGSFELAGTIRRSKAFAGTRKARIVGGAGGWRKRIEGRAYSHVVGVRKKTILEDAANAVGERVSIATDRTVGTSWVRAEGKAERVLRLLAGGEWWVDAAGVTQVRPRPTSAIGSPFSVIARDGSRGRFEIATENYQDWQPGRTFTSPTVTDQQTVSLVNLTSDEQGKLRIVVLTADSERERMLADVRAVIQSELAPLLYACLWEYTVVDADDESFSGKSTDARMPDLRSIPTFPGASEKNVIRSGARVLVAFANADPGKPYVVGVRGGATEHLMTVEATVLLLHNFFAGLSLAHGMFIGPVIAPTIAPLLAAALAASSIPGSPPLPSSLLERAAQEIASASMASGMVAGTPGNAIGLPLPYEAAILALVAKRPNYSGHFPGIGLAERT